MLGGRISQVHFDVEPPLGFLNLPLIAAQDKPLNSIQLLGQKSGKRLGEHLLNSVIVVGTASAYNMCCAETGCMAEGGGTGMHCIMKRYTC